MDQAILDIGHNSTQRSFAPHGRREGTLHVGDPNVAGGRAAKCDRGAWLRNRTYVRMATVSRSFWSRELIDIVKVALTRPLTFIVMAILIGIVGILAAVRTPVDIFPTIRIPVVAVAFQYSGLPPEEMSNRIISQY